MELRRGDLIEIQWVDITEDPVGDPDKAEMPTRHSVGYFWNGSHKILVTTMTMDEDIHDQNGYCIYPMGVITGIKRIRKGKGKVYNGRVPYIYAESTLPSIDSGGPSGTRVTRKHRGTPTCLGHPVPGGENLPEVPESGGLP